MYALNSRELSDLLKASRWERSGRVRISKDFRPVGRVNGSQKNSSFPRIWRSGVSRGTCRRIFLIKADPSIGVVRFRVRARLIQDAFDRVGCARDVARAFEAGESRSYQHD